MESMMIFLGLSSLLCVLKFRKISHKPFTPAWFTWLRCEKDQPVTDHDAGHHKVLLKFIVKFCSLSGVLAASAFCVKYIGIYTGFLVTFLLVQVIVRLRQIIMMTRMNTLAFLLFDPLSPSSLKNPMTITMQDFWRLLPSKSLTDRQLLADFTTRVNFLPFFVIVVIALSRHHMIEPPS